MEVEFCTHFITLLLLVSVTIDYSVCSRNSLENGGEDLLDGYQCPSICTCGYMNTTSYGWLFITNCSGAGISDIPSGVSIETEYLDLSFNSFLNLNDSGTLASLTNLLILDLRGNEDLQNLPLFPHNSQLREVNVDGGGMCCIYEIEWQQKYGNGAKNLTVADCIATTPYHECSTHLVKVITIIIYFVVVFFSLIFNPWIMIVTMCHRPRRKDPITYNAFHFSASNLLTTIYAAVMLCYGIAYLDKYHYHMDSWLNNPGCGTVGFFLLTSTLVSAVLYMIEVICIFMKLRYPLKVDRHMTVRRLTICILVTWGVAIMIASIPFASNRRYNAVGLCLPFYARDQNTGFKFVIFYTAIMGVTVTVNTTLAVLLMKSFMRNRKRRNMEIPQLLINELIAVEKKILIALCVYILIAIVNLAFLIMSCVGGNTGKIGREWYTRIVVLETVTYPLIGPLRAKKFFIDTAKLLRKWGWYEWPGLPGTTSGSDFERAKFSRGSGAHLMRKSTKTTADLKVDDVK